MANVSVSQKCIIPPIFIPPRNLMNIGNSPLYGQEIIKSIETSIGEENTVCVQKVNSTWRITVKTKKVRADILTKGLVVRGHSVQVLSKNPHLIDGQEAIRLMISNIPYEVSEQEIKKALTPLGLKFGSELHWEYYFEPNNASVCKVKSGKRYVFIKPPEKPLPAFIKVLGKHKGYLTLKEEGKKTEKVKEYISGGGHIDNQSGPQPEDQIVDSATEQEFEELDDETDMARSGLGSTTSSSTEQLASVGADGRENTGQTGNVQESDQSDGNSNNTMTNEVTIPTGNRFSVLNAQSDIAGVAPIMSSTVLDPAKLYSLTGKEEHGTMDAGHASIVSDREQTPDHTSDDSSVAIDGPVDADQTLVWTRPGNDSESAPALNSPNESPTQTPLLSGGQLTLEQFNITANVSNTIDSRTSRSKTKGEPGCKSRKGSATPNPKRPLKSPKNTALSKKCKHKEADGKASNETVQANSGKGDVEVHPDGEQGSCTKGKENDIDWFSLKPIG